MDEEFENLCRVCGKVPTEFNYLEDFFPSKKMIPVLEELAIMGVLVREDDDLPQSICNQCYESILDVICIHRTFIKIQEELSRKAIRRKANQKLGFEHVKEVYSVYEPAANETPKARNLNGAPLKTTPIELSNNQKSNDFDGKLMCASPVGSSSSTLDLSNYSPVEFNNSPTMMEAALFCEPTLGSSTSSGLSNDWWTASNRRDEKTVRVKTECAVCKKSMFADKLDGHMHRRHGCEM